MGLYSNDRPACLANQYWTKVGVNGGGKHYNLLQYGNNYCCKKFYSTGYYGGDVLRRQSITNKNQTSFLNHCASFFCLSVRQFNLVLSMLNQSLQLSGSFQYVKTYQHQSQTLSQDEIKHSDQGTLTERESPARLTVLVVLVAKIKLG